MARGKITTLNMDNTLCAGRQQDDLVYVMENIVPDIMVVQEANKTKIRPLLPPEYRTSQVMDREGTMDAAVIWRDAAFTHVRTEVVHILRVGAGGTSQHARYACITTLDNKVGGRRTRVISVHFPSYPSQLLSVIQSPMANNLVRTIKEKRTANLIVGGDFNFDINVDKYNIAGRASLGKAFIDRQGFYLTDSMAPGTVTESSRVDSDHEPVTATIEI